MVKTSLPVRFTSPKAELAALAKIRRVCRRADVRVGANRCGWFTTLVFSGAPDDQATAVNVALAILAGWEAGQPLDQVWP